MVLNVKRPALVILTGALWLTGADPSSAAEPKTKTRDQFILLLAANRVNPTIAGLQQNVVLPKIPKPPTLVRLQRLDRQLQQQSARILQRLEKLNSLKNLNPARASAVERLRNSLTRREAVVAVRLQAVRQLERLAGTPSAPASF